MKQCGFYVESLSAFRVADKLARAGIEVLGVEFRQKNAVIVWVDGKERKKVFAILRGSCYNIKKVHTRGALRIFEKVKGAAGLLLGAALFWGCVGFMQSRVLQVRVEGSGAYYEAQVRDILTESGTEFFSRAPKKDGEISAKILALPRVSFCSLKTKSGVLTVTVEVSDEDFTLASEPLLAPVSGTVEELVVLRGTPCVQAGDAVTAGDTLVERFETESGGLRTVLVIARGTVSYPVSQAYALSRERALEQAFLDYGEIKDVTAIQTADGWRVEGTAYKVVSVNFT